MAADEARSGAALSSPDVDEQILGIAVLGDPVRRALYRYVISQTEPVNRDQVATGTGVSLHVVRFHLDKLADDGLLAVDYARPAGRSGPGAGRPAKLYRRSARELAVSLPPREYELAGRLLAKAVADSGRMGIPVGDALASAARNTGRAIGVRARERAGTRPSSAALHAVATDVLVECGYEPRRDDKGLTLANCPFHALAQEHTELVCGMNLDLLTGLVDGLGTSDLRALLEPAPGQCCVRLQRTPHPKSRRASAASSP